MKIGIVLVTHTTTISEALHDLIFDLAHHANILCKYGNIVRTVPSA